MQKMAAILALELRNWSMPFTDPSLSLCSESEDEMPDAEASQLEMLCAFQPLNVGVLSPSLFRKCGGL